MSWLLVPRALAAGLCALTADVCVRRHGCLSVLEALLDPHHMWVGIRPCPRLNVEVEELIRSHPIDGVELAVSDPYPVDGVSVRRSDPYPVHRVRFDAMFIMKSMGKWKAKGAGLR